MNADKFLKWFRAGVKVLIPVSFFVIASFPKSYWLAGILTVLVIGLYVLEGAGFYEKKV